MLRVITGVPGSGKSLYAVKLMLEAKERGEYIITNVEGFKYADEFIEATTQAGIVDFILARDWAEFAKSLGENQKIYMVIDEAQRVYSSTGMDRKTQQAMFYFLEYHRHYGANVDLVTQSHRSLNTRVLGLLHEIIQISKVSGLSGEQRIRRLDPVTWELIAKDSFKRKQEYFDAYTSASVDSGHQKPTTAMNRLKLQIAGGIALILFFFSIMAYIVYGWIKGTSGGEETPQTASSSPPNHASSDVSRTSTNDSMSSTSVQTQKLQPLYKSLGINLGEFFLLSQMSIGEKSYVSVEYKGASYNLSQLSSLGIQYHPVGSGSAMLFSNDSGEKALIAFRPEVTEKEEKENARSELTRLSPFSSFKDLSI